MRYVCLDFETVGFAKKGDKWPEYTMPWQNFPIQVAIDIVDEDGTVAHAYDTIIAGATGFCSWVHANVPITLEQVKNEGRPFKDVIEDIAALLQDGDCLVAHNARFDLEQVMCTTAKRLKIVSPALDRILGAPRFCTMQCAYSKNAFPRRPKMATLCEHFNVELIGAHDARADSAALAGCVAEALRRRVMLCEREPPNPAPSPPNKIARYMKEQRIEQ